MELVSVERHKTATKFFDINVVYYFRRNVTNRRLVSVNRTR